MHPDDLFEWNGRLVFGFVFFLGCDGFGASAASRCIVVGPQIESQFKGMEHLDPGFKAFTNGGNGFGKELGNRHEIGSVGGQFYRFDGRFLPRDELQRELAKTEYIIRF